MSGVVCTTLSTLSSLVVVCICTKPRADRACLPRGRGGSAIFPKIELLSGYKSAYCPASRPSAPPNHHRFRPAVPLRLSDFDPLQLRPVAPSHLSNFDPPCLSVTAAPICRVATAPTRRADAQPFHAPRTSDPPLRFGHSV
jgi:hypothetical protein